MDTLRSLEALNSKPHCNASQSGHVWRQEKLPFTCYARPKEQSIGDSQKRSTLCLGNSVSTQCIENKLLKALGIRQSTNRILQIFASA